MRLQLPGNRAFLRATVPHGHMARETSHRCWRGGPVEVGDRGHHHDFAAGSIPRGPPVAGRPGAYTHCGAIDTASPKGPLLLRPRRGCRSGFNWLEPRDGLNEFALGGAVETLSPVYCRPGAGMGISAVELIAQPTRTSAATVTWGRPSSPVADLVADQ
jgi:hypothetical protein